MTNLEMKVPPLVVVLVTGVAMWWLATSGPWVGLPLPGRRLIALALAAVGVGFALAGVLAFRQAQTTLHPSRAERTSALVTTGVYMRSRNPMYVGMLSVLAAWGVYLGNVLAFALLPLFVAYLNRFQIEPEERVLAEKFGDEFTAYRDAVRRWI